LSFRTPGKLVLVALGALALGACGLTSQTATTGSAQNPNDRNASPGPGFVRFTDVPMPANASVDLNNLFVMGNDGAWFGRLVMNPGSSVADMYEFYRREMPRFGWQEVSNIRSATSVLVYQQGERVATIQILPSGTLVSSSRVEFSMTPRTAAPRQGSLAPSAQPAPTAQPAPLPAAPRAGVDSAPLPPAR
jgi:hypothetical protein